MTRPRKPFDLAWPLTAQAIENLDVMLEELYRYGFESVGTLDTKADRTDILDVWPESRGGTGESGFTKGDLLVGDADGGVSKLPVGADAKILKANAAAPRGVEWADAPAAGVASVTGTANQIIVGGTAVDPVLSAPQDLHSAATPQFGALGLGAAAEAGSKLKIAGHYYSPEVDDGNGGAAKTVDWSAGNEHLVTLTALSCALTFSNPKRGGRYILVLAQDATGNRGVTWPGNILWFGGAAPGLTPDPGAVDLFAFYYNGTNYIAAGSMAGDGTVTSVGLGLPAEFSVSGSPVTGAGILLAAWASQAAGKVFASPAGGAGVPSFQSDLALGGTYKERGRTTAIGEWLAVAFNAGDFTANGAMTWTVEAGDLTTFAYALVGKTLLVAVIIQTTSVGGTPNTYLQVKLPGGLVAARSTYTPAFAQDNGAAQEVAIARTIAGQSNLYIGRLGGANWSLATNATSIWATVALETQ